MDDLRRWELIGLCAMMVIVVTIPASRLVPRRDLTKRAVGDAAPSFVGAAACRDCHAAEWQLWQGSDHDLAMAEATDETVRGDFSGVEFASNGITSRFYRDEGRFMVRTEGPGGDPGDFEISHTFGFEPLQQYLVPFPGGRMQCLPLAWDSDRRHWFDLNTDSRVAADDWLHWTRNAQNWNGMCAECHSTNLVKGYDAPSDSYTTTWSDIDVACEACHGAGSRHMAWAALPAMARPSIDNAGFPVATRDIGGRQLVELCAPCHARRAELADYDHCGGELLDSYLPTLLVDGLYHPDGQILDEVYVYGSFLQSKMYANEVSCRDCHDSHSLKLHLEGNALCGQCHQVGVYDTTAHHFHKLEVDGVPSPGALCVKCHMMEHPYMVVDWRADHSFRRPRPDLSRELGTPDACAQAGCHADKPSRWLVEAFQRWYGLARRPGFAQVFADARRGAAEAELDLIRLAADDLAPTIVRATALDLLRHYPGPRVDDLQRAAVMSEQSLLRRTAAAAIQIPDPGDRSAVLAPLLVDPVKAVRMAAASQLAGVPAEVLRPYQREALSIALAEYRKAMNEGLDFAASGYNLGNLEAALGHLDDAERFYRLALSVDDLFFPAKMNLAVLLSGQGRNAEAEALLREVLGAYPDNAEAAYSLGLLVAELGRSEEAVEYLEQAATAWPGEARVRYNLGLLLQQLGRLDEAWQKFSEALELEPDNPSFLVAGADHLLRRGQLDGARVLVHRLRAHHPERPEGPQFEAAIQQLEAHGD